MCTYDLWPRTFYSKLRNFQSLYFFLKFIDKTFLKLEGTVEKSSASMAKTRREWTNIYESCSIAD